MRRLSPSSGAAYRYPGMKDLLMMTYYFLLSSLTGATATTAGYYLVFAGTWFLAFEAAVLVVAVAFFG